MRRKSPFWISVTVTDVRNGSRIRSWRFAGRADDHGDAVLLQLQQEHGCDTAQVSNQAPSAAALFLGEVSAGAVGVAGNAVTGPGAAGDAGRFRVDAPEYGLRGKNSRTGQSGHHDGSHKGHRDPFPGGVVGGCSRAA
jgi:hypothetical protein